MYYVDSDENADMGYIVDQWLQELRHCLSSHECHRASQILGQWARNGWKWCDDDPERLVLNNFLAWTSRRHIVLGWSTDIIEN